MGAVGDGGGGAQESPRGEREMVAEELRSHRVGEEGRRRSTDESPRGGREQETEHTSHRRREHERVGMSSTGVTRGGEHGMAAEHLACLAAFCWPAGPDGQAAGGKMRMSGEKRGEARGVAVEGGRESGGQFFEVQR